MPEAYLQTAFEIKAACDEISRRLLRWHWEQRPGPHSLDALLEHVRQRRTESPLYYERLPGLEGRTSWQQMDTTLCMRILLDPENDAAQPLDLLGNTPRPGAARRACNAIRTARNEAAHAADRTASAQAALLFREAVELLEEGYAGSALREADLVGYYRQADAFVEQSRAGAEQQAAAARASTPPRSRAASGEKAPPRGKTSAREKPPTREKAQPAGTRSATPRRPAAQKAPARTQSRKKAPRRPNRESQVSPGFWVAALLTAAAGLALRGYSMGLWPR